MTIKQTSLLRRVPPAAIEGWRDWRPGPAQEGDICVFRLTDDTHPVTVEDRTGRMIAIVPGELFLSAPGYLELRRDAVGGVPPGGLIAGKDYWTLYHTGLVGELAAAPAGTAHLGQATYLGKLQPNVNIADFALALSADSRDRGAPIILILGTSTQTGKTTAGGAVLRTLIANHHRVLALKAGGAADMAEIAHYRDFGACEVYDCLDFGLPAIYPADRCGISGFFDAMLDFCLAQEVDTVLIECAGDPVSVKAPQLLVCIGARRAAPRIVLAAADALGALGAKNLLRERYGLDIDLVTGPCTDTAVLRRRTAALTGIPAVNLGFGSVREAAGASNRPAWATVTLAEREPWDYCM